MITLVVYYSVTYDAQQLHTAVVAQNWTCGFAGELGSLLLYRTGNVQAAGTAPKSSACCQHTQTGNHFNVWWLLQTAWPDNADGDKNSPVTCRMNCQVYQLILTVIYSPGVIGLPLMLSPA